MSFMEIAVLAAFCLMLLVCVACSFSILYALAGGLILFLLYGKSKGFTWAELLKLSLSGVKMVKNILIAFILIGMLTALWRDAGTIPVIVCYAAQIINPQLFVLMAFLLNCLVSVLTGTAFGTAATMGVICMTISSGMQIDPLLTGGAVLSGVFFGDRCSPVSTSALLVANLTQTSIFQNIKQMVRTAFIPFILACAVYAGAGFVSSAGGEVPDLRAIFGREFDLSLFTLLPAVVIFALAAMQIDVKRAMGASIITAVPVSIFVQQTPLADLPQLMFWGYTAADAGIARMLNGGGIVSMLNVSAIVCLSSSYAGLFEKTGLLNSAEKGISLLAAKTTNFAAVLCTAVITAMIACNQVLAVMLTHQLCGKIVNCENRMAIYLEDTAVVVAALVPWSIASTVPLASVGAPLASIAFACFLYILPLWRLLVERSAAADA